MPGPSFGQGDQGRNLAGAAAGLDPGFEPVVAVLRGTEVESIHRGALAVVDIDGALVGERGDPFTRVLLRSAAKPFQAAAVVESGAAEAFLLSQDEVAIIAASHSGADEHVRVVERLLRRAGLTATDLVCGPTTHMCSGKHAGMLLLARYLHSPTEGYEREDHPVQRFIETYVIRLLGSCPWSPPGAVRPGPLFAGTDNCGVPVLRMSVFEAAWLYAALAAGETAALARVRDAMTAHPLLIAGENRFDTRLTRAAAGRVVTKGGAEGVQGIGLLREAGAKAIGFALKIEDGSARPIPSVTALFLRARGLGDVAATIEAGAPSQFPGVTGQQVGALSVLVEEDDVRRRRAFKGVQQNGAPAAVVPATAPAAGGSDRIEAESRFGPRLFGRRDGQLTQCRGDEKDVLRFLRDQWPSVDEEMFGRTVEWSAEPYALVYRRDKKITGVLRAHFIGGVASVDELMVGAGARGLGFGSLLLGRLEDEARRRRCSRIVLRAVKGSPAEDFYRGRGYHRECVQSGYEFGYDYVRLTIDVERALGVTGGAARGGKEA